VVVTIRTKVTDKSEDEVDTADGNEKLPIVATEQEGERNARSYRRANHDNGKERFSEVHNSLSQKTP
jgi:hypothetical protein